MKLFFACIALLLLTTELSTAAEKIKVLLIDGQNNHAWKTTTPVLKATLDNAGLFAVDVATAPSVKNDAAHKADWDKFRPKFSDYAVVVSNYNGELWPEEVRTQFVDFVKNGGGFVSVHAANNSFPQWPEYNQMIGLGGWGGRNEKSGPYLRFNDGKWTKDTTPGPGGGHGKQWEYTLETRAADHPVMKDLPLKWKHTPDELYHNLRGPADNLTVLASAYSDKAMGGTGRDEPLLMAISFGKGRVFHTALGHSADSCRGLGFQITLLRGTEWAATGNVTQAPPKAEELTAEVAAKRDPLAK